MRFQKESRSCQLSGDSPLIDLHPQALLHLFCNTTFISCIVKCEMLRRRIFSQYGINDFTLRYMINKSLICKI